jgi:hypothetical protein
MFRRRSHDHSESPHSFRSRLPRTHTAGIAGDVPVRCAAIDGFAGTMAASDIEASDEPVPAPSLDVLRSLAIPAADEADSAAAVERERNTRKFLQGLLVHDGRT